MHFSNKGHASKVEPTIARIHRAVIPILDDFAVTGNPVQYGCGHLFVLKHL